MRATVDKVIKTAWLFPNIHAVDPLRDIILFHTWLVADSRSLLILASMALTRITGS